MRVVLDTNVIVSAAINATSKPAQLINHWERGTFELVLSYSVLAEYRRVLNYPHIRKAHNLSPQEVEDIVLEYEDDAEILVHIEVQDAVVAADPDDDIVVATAVAGNADFIVSGDRHMLDLGEYRGISIIAPAIFLAILEHEL